MEDPVGSRAIMEGVNLKGNDYNCFINLYSIKNRELPKHYKKRQLLGTDQSVTIFLT